MSDIRTMLVTMTCLAALTAAAPTVPAATDDDVPKLSWLEGTWTGVQDGVASEEHWTSPAGGGLVGMHKDVRNGRMVSFEFLRIAASDTAGVCYLASPRGAPPTPFCAVELSETRVVFENREHDFPQRVMYWRDDRGRLHARVEGTINGKAESEEWTWTRKSR